MKAKEEQRIWSSGLPKIGQPDCSTIRPYCEKDGICHSIISGGYYWFHSDSQIGDLVEAKLRNITKTQLLIERQMEVAKQKFIQCRQYEVYFTEVEKCNQ